MILILFSLFFLPKLLTTHGETVSQTDSSQINNLDLTFHYYSLYWKAENNSEFAYDGVDGYGPKLSNGYRTDVEAQIQGKSGFWDTWEGHVIWGLFLNKETDIEGIVKIRVYASSSFTSDWFLTGVNYGMGVIDADENFNPVQMFSAMAPQIIGSNPLKTMPTLYQLEVSVNHVFQKGHILGFYMAAGANFQRFNFSVYFDSEKWNSGVTLPMKNTMEKSEFDAKWQQASYPVIMISNSSLSNFIFNQTLKQISFNASGINGVNSYTSVEIPKTFMEGPFRIIINGEEIQAEETENATHTVVSFNHLTGSIINCVAIVAVPEFPSLSDILVAILILSLPILLNKRRNPN